MKKLFIYLALLLVSNLALGQSVTLPDGVVFQRKGVGQGADLEIPIDFNDPNLSSVQGYIEQYSVGSGSPNLFMNWTTFSCDAYPGVGGNYRRVKITLPGGLFRVQFRRVDNNGVVTPPIKVGVGEVFYVAGQSNTTGVGSIEEPSPSSTYDNWVKFENNKVETLVFLANQSSASCPDCNVFGSKCNESFPKGKAKNDPSSGYKSHWRIFAEKLVNKLNVPVAIFQAGWSDTSIEEWSTTADGNKVCRYYQNSVDAITTYPYYNLKYLFEARKYNGVRAILWHQGERDGANGSLGTDYSIYKSNLENLISKSRTHIKASMGVTINVPWVISQVSVSKNVSTKSGVTSAQNDVSQQLNNSLGPNTDNIGIEYRKDSTHFNTVGLTKLADAWCDKIIDVNGSFRNTSVPIPAFANSSPPCTSVPNAPSVTSNSTTAPATLTANGCGGTVTWNDGSMGSVKNVSVAGTYSATCTVNGCVSAGASITVGNLGVCVSCQGNTFNDGDLVGTNGSGTQVKIKIENGCAKAYWFNANGNSLVHQNWIALLTGKTKSDAILNSCVTWDGLTNCNNNAPCGGGCQNPPNAPSVTSNSTTLPATLTANGCGGTVTWNDGSTGSVKNVSVAGTYSATCTVNGCVSAGASITIGNPPVGCVSCQGNTFNDGDLVGTNGSGTQVKIKIENGCAKAYWFNANGNSLVHQNWIVLLTGKTKSDAILNSCVTWDGLTNCNNNTPCGGCPTPPNPPTISSPSSCNLSASGCTGTVTWSNGATGNNITVGSSGTYTATCTVGTCVSGNSNTVNVNCSTGGFCPRFNNTPSSGWEYWDFGQSVWKQGNWFAWDANNSRILFAVKESNGLTYVSTSANPGGPQLSKTAFELAVANPALRSCPFTYGTSSRISSYNNEPSEAINVFPNPTNGKITVDFSLENAENVWLNLYNSQGRSMDLKNVEGKEGNNSIEMDIKHYPAGTYFINLQSSQKREVKKVVKID